jgi:cytochrome P450
MEAIQKFFPVKTTTDKLKTLVKVFGLAFLVKVVRYLRWRAKINAHIPGPPDNLLIGACGELYKAGLNDFWGFNPRFFQSLHERYGKIVRFWIPGTGLFVCCADVDDVAELNKKCYHRPDLVSVLLPYLGSDNLLFQKGAMIKNLRMRYGSMVNDKEVLKAVHEVTQKLFEERCTGWGDQKSVDLHAQMDTLIYDISGETIFGSRWTEAEKGKAIRKEHLFLIHWSSRYGMKVLKDPTFANAINAFSDLRAYLGAIRRMRSICGGLIEERRKAVKADPKKYANARDALTMLVSNKKSETDPSPFFSQHLATSTCIGFLNGAYDTTHSTSFWIWFHMATNPEAQKKLREAVDPIFKNGNPSIDAVRECHVLDAFIKESMRMRPTVPIGMRTPAEDVQIGGKNIPEGTSMMIYLNFRACQEAFGSDLNTFKPERFLGSSEAAKRANNAFDRFGGFGRMCVGMTFAQAELRAMISWVAHKYTVELEDPVKYADPEMIYEAGVFQPKEKFRFVFKKRN